jgi:hypothetical protein
VYEKKKIAWQELAWSRAQQTDVGARACLPFAACVSSHWLTMCALEDCLLDRSDAGQEFYPLRTKERQRVLEMDKVQLNLLPLNLTWDGQEFREDAELVSQTREIPAGTEHVEVLSSGQHGDDDTVDDNGGGGLAEGEATESETHVDREQEPAEGGRDGEASSQGGEETVEMEGDERGDGEKLACAEVGMQGEEAWLLPIRLDAQAPASKGAGTLACCTGAAAANVATVLESTVGAPGPADAMQSGQASGCDGGRIEGEGKDLEQRMDGQPVDGSDSSASAGPQARPRTAAEERTMEARANLERCSSLPCTILLRTSLRPFSASPAHPF